VVGESHFTALCGTLALAGALCACDRHPPVIGFAYSRPTPNAADVAREALARRANGRGLEIRIERDSRASGPSLDVEMATRLVAIPGMAGVVGHQDSRGSLLAAPIYAEARIPLVIPTGTSRLLQTASPWVFTLAPDDSAEGSFIAEFAVGPLGARTIAILYDNDEYGRGLRDGVRAALTQRGRRLSGEAPIGAVCAPTGATLGGEASIALVTPPRAPPDVVVIAGRTRDAACIGRQVAARAPGVQLIAGDGVEIDSAFVRELGGAADSVYVVAFWYAALPHPGLDAFVAAHRRIVGRAPTASEAMQFDALLLLAQAIRDVGANPAAVRNYLADLGASRPPYPGVTGPISFAPGRQRPLFMLRLRQGVTIPAVLP
jgi:branched-chain amino acid transport system substrate-binding protein